CAWANPNRYAREPCNVTRTRLLPLVLLACSSNPQRLPSNSRPEGRTGSSNLELVTIDAPPSTAPFGLTIVIEANGPRFAVRWEGLAARPMPPISVDSTPTRAVETLRTELADDRIETMPVSMIVDRRVPWSFVAQITQVAQATHHPQANFAFLAKDASKTW